MENNKSISLWDHLKLRAHGLKKEVYAVYFAARDPRTPWYAKALVLLIVAYAFSPMDLIPDFVPVLGYLDDLILLPGGIWLAIRMIPPEVLAEARTAAAAASLDQSAGKAGAAIVVMLWIIAIILSMYLVLRWTKRI